MAHTGLVCALISNTGVVFAEPCPPSRVTHAAALGV